MKFPDRVKSIVHSTRVQKETFGTKLVLCTQRRRLVAQFRPDGVLGVPGCACGCILGINTIYTQLIRSNHAVA